MRRCVLWVTAAAAVVGTVAVTSGERWGFGVWMVTDVVWMTHNARRRDWPQAALWAVYLVLAVWGLVK